MKNWASDYLAHQSLDLSFFCVKTTRGRVRRIVKFTKCLITFFLLLTILNHMDIHRMWRKSFFYTAIALFTQLFDITQRPWWRTLVDWSVDCIGIATQFEHRLPGSVRCLIYKRQNTNSITGFICTCKQQWIPLEMWYLKINVFVRFYLLTLLTAHLRRDFTCFVNMIFAVEKVRRFGRL